MASYSTDRRGRAEDHQRDRRHVRVIRTRATNSTARRLGAPSRDGPARARAG